MRMVAHLFDDRHRKGCQVVTTMRTRRHVTSRTQQTAPYAPVPSRRIVDVGDIDMTALGFALLLIGAVLIVAEAHVPGGVLGVTGGLALAVGGIVVIAGLGGGAALALPVGVGLGVATVGSVLLVSRQAARAQHGRVRSGAEALCGCVGVVRGWSEPAGQVFVGGALWRARRSWGELEEGGAPLHEGDPVVVERVDGLTLSVRPAEEWELIA
jgi:membrane-bound serine protease (ClpP class)